ncbi:MAG: hypothetical protein DRP06_01545 [Candidatus Aenigmatarchaeota archaeon]|nr:MAG: hypothetical protein DRP06_01545 [Candidatus Aenigmarchaeota archaeon]
MKGMYPLITYILLFAVGISVSASIYYFTENFAFKENLDLENAKAYKLCAFLRSLEGKEGEFELDIGDFRIDTAPLRFTGFSSYKCDLILETSGYCYKECRIKVLEDKIEFS